MLPSPFKVDIEDGLDVPIFAIVVDLRVAAANIGLEHVTVFQSLTENTVQFADTIDGGQGVEIVAKVVDVVVYEVTSASLSVSSTQCSSRGRRCVF